MVSSCLKQARKTASQHAKKPIPRADPCLRPGLCSGLSLLPTYGTAAGPWLVLLGVTVSHNLLGPLVLLRIGLAYCILIECAVQYSQTVRAGRC